MKYYFSFLKNADPSEKKGKVSCLLFATADVQNVGARRSEGWGGVNATPGIQARTGVCADNGVHARFQRSREVIALKNDTYCDSSHM